MKKTAILKVDLQEGYDNDYIQVYHAYYIKDNRVSPKRLMKTKLKSFITLINDNAEECIPKDYADMGKMPIHFMVGSYIENDSGSFQALVEDNRPMKKFSVWHRDAYDAI